MHFMLAIDFRMAFNQGPSPSLQSYKSTSSLERYRTPTRDSSPLRQESSPPRQHSPSSQAPKAGHVAHQTQQSSHPSPWERQPQQAERTRYVPFHRRQLSPHDTSVPLLTQRLASSHQPQQRARISDDAPSRQIRPRAQEANQPSDPHLRPQPLGTSQIRQHGQISEPVSAVPVPPRSAPPSRSRFMEADIHSQSPESLVSPLMSNWDSQASLRRAKSDRQSAFHDDVDVGLFAEALSGLGSDLDLSTSPRRSPQADIRPPLQPHALVSTYATSSSHSVPAPSYGFDAPSDITPWLDISGGMSDVGTSSSHPLPIPVRSSSTHTESRSRVSTAVNVPATLSPEDFESMPPTERTGGNDDALPSYEQSQLEAAEHTRQAALRRAAELESRWAASSYRRR